MTMGTPESWQAFSTAARLDSGKEIIAREASSPLLQSGWGMRHRAGPLTIDGELFLREIPFRREVHLPVDYKGRRLECSYRLDLLVADSVVVEVKSLPTIEAVHEAQLLTYMKLGRWPLGLLINFNVATLKTGIRRRVL